MKSNFYFYIGVFLFSILLGVLMTISATPLAGSIITGIFGITVALVSLFLDKSIDSDQRLKLTGQSLTWVHFKTTLKKLT